MYVLGEAEVSAFAVTLEQLLEPHAVRVGIAQLGRNRNCTRLDFRRGVLTLFVLTTKKGRVGPGIVSHDGSDGAPSDI